MLARAEAPSAIEIAARFMKQAPVDLDGMAGALGVEVVSDPRLPEGIAGRIERSGRGYRATINGRDGRRRQRFTLAHELAHVILHRDLLGDGIVDDVLYRSRMSSDIESQANRFAADLLMPAALMREFWRQGVRSFADMAARFDVSAEAARIRMHDLFPA